MKAINIEWDTDVNNTIILPTEIEIPNNMNHNDISDYLSDVTGFCHYGYNLIDSKI